MFYAVVYSFFQCWGCLEAYNLTCFNLCCYPVFGVASSACFLFFDVKNPEIS